MKVSVKQLAVTLYEATHGLKGKELDGVIERFVKLLASRGMLSKANRIIDAFAKYSDEAEGAMTVGVSSAHPLDEASQRQLQAQLERQLGKTVLLQTKVDPKLMGGLRLQMADMLVDSSLSGSLEQLRANLRAA